MIQLWKKPNFIKTNDSINSEILEGYYKGEIKIGDIVEVSNCHVGSTRDHREVIKVIERRDYVGHFENPEDKINAYFKIEVK